jgi:hypothetical protein
MNPPLAIDKFRCYLVALNLDASGIRWRVIAVSKRVTQARLSNNTDHSGTTASAADKASFGRTNTAENDLFG